MDHDELLQRLDRHLARADEHMARGNRIMARSNRIMARSNEIMARNEIAFRDLSEFLAQQTEAMRGLTRAILRHNNAN